MSLYLAMPTNIDKYKQHRATCTNVHTYIYIYIYIYICIHLYTHHGNNSAEIIVATIPAVQITTTINIKMIIRKMLSATTVMAIIKEQQ